MRNIFIATALVASVTTPALAEEFSLGGGVSTVGPILEARFGLNGFVAMRGIAAVPIDLDFDAFDVGNDYTLDGTVSLGSGAIMVDVHPIASGWANGFRLSGGIFFAPDEVASGSFDGIEPFDGSLQLDNTVAPIASIGYRYSFDNGIFVSGDLGAIISGFSVTTPSTDADVLNEVGEINDALDDLPIYPYVALTIGFTF